MTNAPNSIRIRPDAPAVRLATPGPATDPVRLARLVALLYLEVEAGRRPACQLQPLAAPALYARLREISPPGALSRVATIPAHLAIRAISAFEPAEGALEASVVVSGDQRVTALALRLERHHGRWRVVEIARPESGLTARRTASVRG